MSTLWQLCINGLVSGAAYALVALGFGLIYQTCRFFHFAHGAVFAWGAYFAFFLVVLLGVSRVLAFPVAAAGAAALGMAIDAAVYGPLRRRQSSPLVLLLASLGLFVLLQNLIPLTVGDGTRTLRTGSVRAGYEVLGARITSIQAVIVLTSGALLGTVWWVLQRTRIGRAVRAVASDGELAQISGVQSERVLLFTFGAGSALAGAAGILVALDVDLTPVMGTQALLMAVTAVIIGGVGSVAGAALGGLFVGLIQHTGGFIFGSRWQDAFIFAVLLFVLVFRPTGLFGRRAPRADV